QTRLIVKNVPKHIDDKRLREHFVTQGRVTDARVARTAAGKSRLFGFIGFGNEEDAQRAKNFFNGTFLDTSRIQVEVARPKGDTALPRAWSRHTPGSSRFPGVGTALVPEGDDVGPKAAKAGGSDSGRAGGAAADLQKEEFMAVMKRRRDSKFWANDDAMDSMGAAAAERAAAAAAKVQPGKSLEARNGEAGGGSDAGSSSGGADDAGESGDSSSDGDASEEAETASGDTSEDHAAEGGAKNPQRAGMSDMDWLRSRSSLAVDGDASSDDGNGSESSGGGSDDEEDNGEGASMGSDIAAKDATSGEADAAASSEAGAAAAAAEKGAEDPAPEADEEEEDSGRLFVRNLAFDCGEDDLRALFAPFGPVSEVHLPVDELRRGKGFAFVQFMLPENAAAAVVDLDGKPFQGRLLHVLPARVSRGGGGGGNSGGAGGTAAAAPGAGAKTYKARKEAERRAAAGDSSGWNAAFVRSDTVVDALAHRLGVAKGEVLDREESDMALRLALAETQLVRENKEYFQLEGVDLSALDGGRGEGGARPARSDTVILVKNLPFSTEPGELPPLPAVLR
ncbi:unnamed protein product, partial [Phaeothamnion confervicola]